ncbi:GSCFA domain protein [uncultured Paludibacter sp.]|uniref:GSCFA domain protein n=1 Tax=uncultured Paludibacter sp. TaxID=497635 RepID=A0A653A628_9BACT|nr:GSCFA domain protein [uncultured Paludibacter sp.]
MIIDNWFYHVFTTKVNIPASTVQIGYNDKLMTLGSCFAENIGKKLTDAFFQVNINPFGVLYNPMSVNDSLQKLMGNDFYTETELFEHQSLWHSFSHSSLYSGETKKECLQKINASLQEARKFLQETRFLLITFGTAWIYENTEDGKTVANCHKLPANRFHRRRLSVTEIGEKFTILLSQLKARNPHLEVIFTVSPIRHWKDGAHENNVSKSVLHLAIEELKEKFPFVHYFPAYEIQLDELRDYRFYAPDMLHPSETAVDYIWKRFSETYFGKETEGLKKELEQLRADLNHRPLHPESSEYQQFLKSVEKRKAKLQEKYPGLGSLLEGK